MTEPNGRGTYATGPDPSAESSPLHGTCSWLATKQTPYGVTLLT